METTIRFCIYDMKMVDRGDYKAAMVQGKLYETDSNGLDSWTVLSGGAGYGPMPAGRYEITELLKIEDVPENSAYKAAEGFPWIARLNPLFKTHRTALLLHPEGGEPDITLGCGGVKFNTDSCYYWLESLLKIGRVFLNTF